MKKVFLLFFIAFLCVSLFASCETLRENGVTPEGLSESVCEHEWKRTSNLNESTAVDKCEKCGDTRYYTDPDSLPKNYYFNGSVRIAPVDVRDVAFEFSSDTVLNILNGGLWEKEILANEFKYIFTVNNIELLYAPSVGIFADFEECRQLVLDEEDRIIINSILDGRFIDGIEDGEVPEVLVRVDKWTEIGFEATVADNLISYLESGDKVSVVLNDGAEVSREEYPVGTLAVIRFNRFNSFTSPDILYSEAVEGIEDEKIDFSFSFVWNVYGSSSYDSESGRLIKSVHSPDVEKYTATYCLTENDIQYIYHLINKLDVASYPDVYDPNEGWWSEPSLTFTIKVRIGNFEKTVNAPNVSLFYECENEKGRRFLKVCRAIEELLTSTDEWKALPETDVFYE